MHEFIVTTLGRGTFLEGGDGYHFDLTNDESRASIFHKKEHAETWAKHLSMNSHIPFWFVSDPLSTTRPAG